MTNWLDNLLWAPLSGSVMVVFETVAVTLNANTGGRNRGRCRCLWVLLALGIALGMPTAGLHRLQNSLQSRYSLRWHPNRLKEREERASTHALAVKPYVRVMLVQVVPPALVAMLWCCYRLREDLRHENGPAARE